MLFVKTFQLYVRLFFGIAFALILVVLFFPAQATNTPAAAAVPAARNPGRQLSDGAIAGRFLSHANPSMRLNVVVLLKGRRLDEIPRLLMAQADPHSPLFRHWLTPAQYGNYFGATPNQVQQTVAYLRSRGFTISDVAPNNRYILTSAPVTVVEAAFATPIEIWQCQKGVYYTNRFTPAIPNSLPWVEGVTGLDSYHVMHRHLAGQNNGGGPLHPDAAVTPGQFGFGPQDLYKAYDFDMRYTGAGKTIAIPEGRNALTSDVFVYDAQFGIRNASFTKVFLAGTCPAPDPLPTSSNDSLETALDTEVAHAVAPAAAIIVVSQNDLINSSTVVSFEYIANVLASSVQAVSTSYGLCESNSGPIDRAGIVAAIDQGTLEGQVWVGAAGDDVSDDCKSGLQDVDFPASAPNIVAAGGTTLNTVIFHGNVVSYTNEYAWNNSGCGAGIGGATGGGLSRFYGKPSWQNAVTFNDKVRDVPDIAAEADPAQETRFPADCAAPGGYWVIVKQKWVHEGGTSGAAPFWAGVFADLSEQQRANLGLVHPALYALKSTTAYHQVTIGNNAFRGVAGYNAGTGYNRVTGLGSPDETQFIAKFAQTRPPTPKPTAFPALVAHPMATPVAKPTARAFIPIGLDANKFTDVGVFDATVGANQGKQIQIFGGSNLPADTAAAATGNAVYVLGQTTGTLDKITTNVKPFTYTKNAFTFNSGRFTAIAVKGAFAYITDWFNGVVVKLNLTTGLSSNINVGHGASAIVPNPLATALYFTNAGDGTVGVINSTTNLLVQTFKVGANPSRLAVNHAGTKAYVPNSGDGTITPVTLGAVAVPGTPVYVGGEPTSIAINSNDTLGFVTNMFCPQPSTKCNPTGNEALGVVEVLTLKTTPIGVECCITVGQAPVVASFEPTGHYVWVINGGSNSISIIDSFTNLVTTTVVASPPTYSQWGGSSNFIQLTPK